MYVRINREEREALKNNTRKICSSCGHRPVGGDCTINGQRRNLVMLCRECFINDTEDSDFRRCGRGRNSIVYKGDDR